MRRTSGWRRPWGPAGKRIAHHDGHLARRRRGRDGVAFVEEEAGADASPVAAPDDARTVDSAPPSLGGENTAAVAPRRRQREQGERAAALVARDDFAKKQKSVDVRQQAIDAYVAGKKVSAIANFCGVQGEFPPHVLRLHCTQMLR